MTKGPGKDLDTRFFSKRKELSRSNKKHFPSFLKGFQKLPKIAKDCLRPKSAALIDELMPVLPQNKKLIVDQKPSKKLCSKKNLLNSLINFKQEKSLFQRPTN